MAQSPVTVEPVHPGLDAAVLEDLGRRLSAVRLAPGGGTGWEQGVPRPWLASLLAGWRQFDTGAFQARLDRLAHARASAGGLVIHLVHEPGRGGWRRQNPGSSAPNGPSGPTPSPQWD